MIPNVQIITEDGKPRFAVLAYHTLKRLEELVEDALDVKEAQKVLRDPATAWKDFAEVRKRLLTNPIRDMRKKVGITQRELAGRLKVNQSFITKIERPGYNPSKRTLLKIAKALSCSVEELL